LGLKSCERLILITASMTGFVAISPNAQATEKSAETRQLIQLTSQDNILRIDAEQAGFIIDRLPEDLPQELRSQVRRAVDVNLDYNKMQQALISGAASKLDRDRLDSHSRWWASTSGRAIARAESSIYAALFADSSFDIYHHADTPADQSNAELVEEVIQASQFPEFVSQLGQATTALRLCLVSNVMAAEQTTDCAQIKNTMSTHAASLTERIARIAAAKYSSVSSGDLGAYLAFLGSDNAFATLKVLRAANLQVEQDSWQRALQQADSAVAAYAKSHFSRVDAATLNAIIADIDNARNLPQARFNLRLLSRSAPPDARVFVQLARVTLKLARDVTDNDAAPSVPRLDGASLKAAQQYIDEALALDPHSADTLMIAGHIAYLQRQFQHSVELLENAAKAGGTSPWLHVNLGDVVWALGMQPPAVNHAYIQRAADEFETALRSPLPPAAENRAVHQLGAAYAELGEVAKADGYYRRYVSMESGRNKAYAQHRYAHFLLFYAKDTDAALAAAREAVQTYDFPLGRTFLLQMLLIKAGTLVSSGRTNELTPLLDEARQMQPDLAPLGPELARLPAMYPGVIGIHAAGADKDFAGRMGGQMLVLACLYATPQQIEQLLAWGANPNYFDPDEGTPLHLAILANNVDAVRTLLAHGANPSTPFIDGRTPSELASGSSDSRRAEILVLVRSAGGISDSSAAIGGPFKLGYEYLLKKDLDGIIDGKTWAADPYSAGEHLIYQGECRYTDSSVGCFLFKRSAIQGRVFQLAITKKDLVSWTEWFQELGLAR
jgi:tetratricopeptide (TPR) repeat protein